MRIGLPLEGIFVDMDAHFHFWIARMGVEVDSRLAPKILKDESFWASPKANDGISEIGDLLDSLSKYGDEFFILTERPPDLLPITRSWLKRHGINVKSENIILSSREKLKRYDCRLNKIEYYLDIDSELLSSFRYDYTIPVGIGDREDFESWMQAHPTVIDALSNLDPDIRSNYIWEST